ncbi:tyrosine-type recombinase/integrase [Streptomyces sp. NPDC087425]|uniref:tyrosine-type recombinase/integrase n=1 Tax=Streptomyces sp. NPDC087425 TaxID=3365787 RepID=UPI00381E6A34
MAKRRPNGGGTITQRKDGRYQGAAYVTDTDGNRVRKFVYGATYDEANVKLGKLQQQEREGVPVPSRSWSVGDWLNYWIDHIVKPNREFNTYSKYESKVRLYLLPHLGKTSITRLTPAKVRSVMALLTREEVPAPTRFEVLRTLRNALNRAVKEEILTRNVALLVDMPKVDTDKGKAWNPSEAIRFLYAARAHRFFAAFVLVLVLGLRRSELLGLRRQDINFETGQFTPVKQVQRVKGKGLVLKNLKTDSSSAPLPLPNFCARALEQRFELQDLERQIAGDKWHQDPDHDVIFSNEHGGLTDPVGFGRTFVRLLKRSGVRRITLRIARKTCASLLAYLKVHPKVAQKIMRHSEIKMTLDIYTQIVGDSEREAVDMLAELLENPLLG